MLDGETLLTLRCEQDTVFLEIFHIPSQSRRLRLLLPFRTIPCIWGSSFDSDQSFKNSTEHSISYYSRDRSSDRILAITFIDLQSNKEENTYCVAISAHQILSISRSSTDEFRQLTWSEWGPPATRWFNLLNRDVYFSTQGTYGWFNFRGSQFLKHNKLPLITSSNDGILFCDFNLRYIRRYLQPPSLLPTSHSSTNSEGQGQYITALEEIQEHLITEEWVFRSPGFTEDVHSRLPFRAFVRPQDYEKHICPDIGFSPTAVFEVSPGYFRWNYISKTRTS